MFGQHRFCIAGNECCAGVVGGFDGAVYEADLVFVQQMREHIAGGHGISFPAELPPRRVGVFFDACGR